MRIESGNICPHCVAEIIIYTAKNTPAQCLARTLPAWQRCRCGWCEIATSTLEGLVPDWRTYLDPDEEGLEEEDDG